MWRLGLLQYNSYFNYYSDLGGGEKNLKNPSIMIIMITISRTHYGINLYIVLYWVRGIHNLKNPLVTVDDDDVCVKNNEKKGW